MGPPPPGPGYPQGPWAPPPQRHGWITFGIGMGVAALALLAYVGLILGLIVNAESSGFESY